MANLPSVPSIPANVDPQLQQVLNAMKTQLDYAQANPASNTTNAVDQAQLDTAVANAVTGITKGDTGAPGAAGSPGANGKTYVLDITGGRTSIIYDATGSSPLPAMSAFSATLYEDGVEVTPSSYSWFISDSANSLLSGSGSSSTFTPTVAGTFDQAKGNNAVVLVVGYLGLSLRATEPIAMTKIGDTGDAGVNGKTYLLFITGGKTNVAYDADGINPSPAPTAFSAELYEDGALVTPDTYTWSVPATNSLLSGSATSATFTPTLAATFDANKADNRILLTATYGGQTAKAVQPIVITKLAATGIDSTTPIAISDLSVTGGVLYNFLSWGENPGNADHVDIYRASTKPTLVPVALTLNGNATIVGSTASKATPAASYDTQAYSSESFTSAGAIRFKFTSSNSLECMAGLDSNPSASALGTTIDYAIRAYSDGTIHVWENAADIGAFGTFSTTDTFEIEYSGTSIVYKKNGTGFRTSTVSAGQTLYFDSGFYDYLSAVNSIQIGGYADVATFSAGTLTLDNTGNADTVTVTSNSITKSTGRPTITKTAGSSAWDSQAYSSQSLTTTCGVKATINSTSKDFAIGLDSNPTQDAGYLVMDYQINFYSDNTVHIWESGTHIGAYGAYALNDEFEIKFTGSQIEYKKNGSTIYTHSGVSSGTFFVDSSLFTVGSSFKNVQFGTYSGSVFSPQALTLNTTGSAGTMDITYPSAWDSQGFSTQSYTSACAVRFSFGSTTKAAYCGLDQSPSGSANNTSIDYAWHALADESLQIVLSGSAVTNPATSTTNWGAYATTDVFEVEYIGTSIIFKQNGATKHTATVSSGLTLYVDSSLYDVGGSITGIQFGQYSPVSTFVPGTLTLGGNATLTADSATKPSLPVNWDEQAYSVQSIVAEGAVRFVFPSTNLAAMAGLDASPDTSADSGTIDYAIRTYTDGTFHLFENTSDLGSFGNFTTTDVFEIEYTGSQIKYKQNGLTLRTSIVVAGQTLYFDSSLYNFNASIASIQLGAYSILATRADAAVIGSSSSRVFADYIPDGVETTYNYWIRAVSRSGVLGDWNTVGGVVSDAGTSAAPLGIGDSQVSTISATKIFAYSLAAITANLGNITAGKMESPDGNFVVDLAEKAITIAGANGLTYDDYTLFKNGVVQFFKHIGGGVHQQGASLQTIEAGTAANGATITLTKYYSGIPKIQVSAHELQVYSAEGAGLAQTIQVRADNVTRSPTGVVSFTAVCALTNGFNETWPNPDLVGSGITAVDYYEMSFITQNTNVYDVVVNFRVSSVRGSGTLNEYKRRRVRVRARYRRAYIGEAWVGGAWTYTDYVTVDIGESSSPVDYSILVGAIEELGGATTEVVTEFTAEDLPAGTVFTLGDPVYDYKEDTINTGGEFIVDGVVGADPYTPFINLRNSHTGTSGSAVKTLVPRMNAFTPASGYEIYQVEYSIDGAWGITLTRDAPLIGTSISAELSIVGMTSIGVVRANDDADFDIGGVLDRTLIENTTTFDRDYLHWEASVSWDAIPSQTGATTCFYDVGGYNVGISAKVRTRKARTSSTTPSNEFRVMTWVEKSYNSTQFSSGILNYIAIE